MNHCPTVSWVSQWKGRAAHSTRALPGGEASLGQTHPSASEGLTSDEPRGDSPKHPGGPPKCNRDRGRATSGPRRDSAGPLRAAACWRRRTWVTTSSGERSRGRLRRCRERSGDQVRPRFAIELFLGKPPHVEGDLARGAPGPAASAAIRATAPSGTMPKRTRKVPGSSPDATGANDWDAPWPSPSSSTLGT